MMEDIFGTQGLVEDVSESDECKIYFSWPRVGSALKEGEETYEVRKDGDRLYVDINPVQLFYVHETVLPETLEEKLKEMLDGKHILLGEGEVDDFHNGLFEIVKEKIAMPNEFVSVKVEEIVPSEYNVTNGVIDGEIYNPHKVKMTFELLTSEDEVNQYFSNIERLDPMYLGENLSNRQDQIAFSPEVNYELNSIPFVIKSPK